MGDSERPRDRDLIDLKFQNELFDSSNFSFEIAHRYSFNYNCIRRSHILIVQVMIVLIRIQK